MAVPLHRGNLRGFRHAKDKITGVARTWSEYSEIVSLLGLAESHGHGLRAPIAPHRELHRSSGRNLVNHAPELRGAFDALPVDFRYDVIFLQPGFSRRAVWDDLSDNDPA